jgi:hypothetical protein
VRVGNSGVCSIIIEPVMLHRHAACLRDDNSHMKEYQAVVVKLTRHTREDEDTLTDLLNERSRGGWEPALMSQDEHRLTILFQRSAVAEG